MGNIYIVTSNGAIYQFIASNSAYLAWLIVSICLAIGFYALRSIGVFMIARRSKEYSHLSFLAFIPFAWIYLVISLSDKIVLFGKKLEHMAIWFPIAIVITLGLILTYNCMTYVPLYNYLASGKNIYMGYVEKTSMTLNQYVLNTSIYTEVALNPYSNMSAIKSMLTTFNIIGLILEIILTVLNIFVYMTFFRKYWPQHMLLATIFSFLGFFAIFAFIVRNNEPIDFNEYVKQQYAKYGNPYNNPYNNGQNPNNNQNNQNDDPFNMGGNNSQNNNNNSNNQNNNSGNNNNNNDDPFGF